MAQRTRQFSNRIEAEYWMASPPETRFRLLHQFGDFYAEIFRLKQLARDGAATAEVRLPTGDGTEHGGPDGGNGNAIRVSVAELLDRKAAEDKRIDDPTAAEVQRELLYIMIAVADEIFALLASKPVRAATVSLQRRGRAHLSQHRDNISSPGRSGKRTRGGVPGGIGAWVQRQVLGKRRFRDHRIVPAEARVGIATME